MKRILSLFLIVFLLCGCTRKPRTYPFENKDEPIKSVELLYYPWYEDHSQPFMEFQLIRTLAYDEIPEFMNKVYSLETVRSGPPPHGNYGLYIARVSYENGDMEYYGTHHIEFVKSGSDACAVGYYFFLGDAFDTLFLEYAGDFSDLVCD